LPTGAGLINGFTLPSFLPFFTVFFAIFVSPFLRQDPGAACCRNGCNRTAKEVKSRSFPLLHQNKELASLGASGGRNSVPLNMFENSAKR
jgi:hypothetical protein